MALEDQHAKSDVDTKAEESDPLKVKFSGQGADETKVDIGEAKEEDELRALTKSELMKYATDPFWVTLRWTLFVLFWVAWVAMLVAAVAIIIVAPKCPTPAPKQWWQKSPIYEVYVKSFKDSNGDGIGDIKGIQEKLPYFEELGIKSLWLTPIFKSPMKDNGYDIENYVDVDPMFGTMEDFKDLVAAMKERGMKLILDFVPNHSSDQHPWFKWSVEKKEPYTDFYIWKPGKGSNPPNNWKNVFGGSAWTYNNERQEYYLHQFYKEQPDLNLRNPEVVQELKNILQFWMDLGVDGFRVNGVAHFFEDESLNDEPQQPGQAPSDDYGSLQHTLTFDQKENLVLLQEFRQVLDNKTEEDPANVRMMMTEAYLSVDAMVKYYGDERVVELDDKSERSTVSHMPLNFAFLSDFADKSQLGADNVYQSIEGYLNSLPKWAWPNFQLSNHDNSRAASRFGDELVDAMNMVYMLLPGTPITYYGEEIGMKDGSLSNPVDKRDPVRTPMQWSSEANAGFTSADSPWVSVNPDYVTLNAEAQLKAENGNSHAKIYSHLAKMRDSETILLGSIQFVNSTANNIFGYTRVLKGNPGTLVLVNFGEEKAELDLTGTEFLPERGSVQIRSVFDEANHTEDRRSVTFESVSVMPKEGLVITFVPKL